ncbi:large ribosomal subunit protein bL27-like [Rhopilema esculentum]|uniref:large ribosomal subunit protein bL27-like n=1 Tax=Rhopilema esculentum TaxID=499914 RepID=UPI0031D38429|eukprot:gene9130-16790_t
MWSLIGSQLKMLVNRTFKEVNFPGIPLLLQTCNATKKAGGQARKQGKNRRGKRRGVKKLDGCHVKAGQILVRQLGYKFHPGKNVGYSRDHTLFSLCEGYVKYTRELLELNPIKLPRRPLDYAERKFINVIERPKSRKLICVNEHEMSTNVKNDV